MHITFVCCIIGAFLKPGRNDLTAYRGRLIHGMQHTVSDRLRVADPAKRPASVDLHITLQDRKQFPLAVIAESRSVSSQQTLKPTIESRRTPASETALYFRAT